MFSVLKPYLQHNHNHVCYCYDHIETLTKIKFYIKTSPAFQLCLFAYSYCLFEKINKAPLNYSLEALFHFPVGGYTHAALETV